MQPETKPKTLAEVLEAASPAHDQTCVSIKLCRGKINNFLAIVCKNEEQNEEEQNNKKRCYFLASHGVDFRHEGNTGFMPTRVYVRDLSRWVRQRVAVFHSASGTGKTVELASSAATRGADFTIILQFEDDIDAKYNEFEFTNWKLKAERNMAALSKIKEKIQTLLEDNRDQFHDMILAKQGVFRFVIAIDEASSCRILARALICDAAYFSNELTNLIVKQTLPDGICPELEVSFSVGGTGAPTNSIGSLPSTFQVIEPTAALAAGIYWKASLKEIGFRDPDQLKEDLPILGCLMENGRMASIAICLLRQQIRESSMPNARSLQEADLVDTIIEAFMYSNGLSGLDLDRGKEKAAAYAACAFAVLLFQWDRERPSPSLTSKERNKYLFKFKSGVEFIDITSNPYDKERIVKDLVVRYGLLEQNDQSPRKIGGGRFYFVDPFRMRPSQQLVALQLMGVRAREMVASNPYGLEVLTTQIIKVALAATSVIVESKRPSVMATLAKIGVKTNSSILHESTSNILSTLDSLKVVPHYFKNERTVMDTSYRTHLMKVELEIFQREGKKMVMIDAAAGNRLEKITQQNQYSRSMKNVFHPPIACINYGNSSLADGFVSCIVKNDQDQVFQFTIMNQSKDKHTTTSGLHISGLNSHADRCADPVLDGLFGEKRLLCVSTPRDYVSNQNKCRIKRKFASYVLLNCEILGLLMRDLNLQRSKEGRKRLNGAIYDSEGRKIQITGTTEEY